MNITFFCSSSNKLSPVFYSEAKVLGEHLSEHNLIYGGSNCGLMGSVAGGSLAKGGKVIGIITEGLNTDDNQQQGLDQLIVCSGLNERKKQLVDKADVFLILPGGFGTLDEALEVLALKQVGELNKPIIFYNCFGFWDTFFELSQNLHEQRMIPEKLGDLYHVAGNVEELKQLLQEIAV